MRDLERVTPNAAAALLAAALGCASAHGAAPASATDLPAPAVAAREEPGARNANLAGSRCSRGPSAPCTCRNLSGDPTEDPPPDEGHKRFEIRMSAQDGAATLDSPTLGHFAAGEAETCFYVDVVPGTMADVVFSAHEARPATGFGPMLEISEYGPKGPWWYKILDVRCSGPEGKCNRDAADEWGQEIKTRKRGRIDPCGSTVVTGLRWDTSGGTGKAELALFRDLTVRFAMEVKRFHTQFHPGSTECVPK
jgi:hypothetical protein